MSASRQHEEQLSQEALAKIRNEPATAVTYFTPAQLPPAGTAYDPQPDGQPIPKLFQPLKLRGLTLQNRVVVSPMCQYSADYGHMTFWHKQHLGSILARGPGLTCIESTSVTPEGRISPEDVGLWQDSQMPALKEIVDFAHSQGQKIMIQLSHAGRKASTLAPWLSGGDVANEHQNGWPDKVLAPSAIAYNDRHAQPKKVTKDDIEAFKAAFVAAVKRALAVGIDAIEIHNAHGYLLHEFISPASNQRTDEYGGSFENRIRLTLEVVELVRATIPEDMPLVLRISADDWLTESAPEIESWKVADTVRLAPLLADRGVDLLDVSSAGLHPKQHIHVRPGYQVPFALAIKKAVGDRMAVSTVGSITEGVQANNILEEGLDAVTIGRTFLKNPGMVWQFADELGVQAHWANQQRWPFAGRASKPKGAASDAGVKN